jgi:hypothetical protein
MDFESIFFGGHGANGHMENTGSKIYQFENNTKTRRSYLTA